MRLPPFELHQPATLGAALELLDEHADQAAVYLGGSDLLPRMRLGQAHPRHLVDCKRIPGMAAIGELDGDLRLGAAVTHAALALDHSARLRACGLAGLARQIGNVRVRNAGTLGGSLCAARSRSDPATLLVALDSVVRLVSRSGERELTLASEAEELLAEGGLSAVPDACEAAVAAVDPVDDEFGSRGYKRQLVRVLVDRAVRELFTRPT